MRRAMKEDERGIFFRAKAKNSMAKQSAAGELACGGSDANRCVARCFAKSVFYVCARARAHVYGHRDK